MPDEKLKTTNYKLKESARSGTRTHKDITPTASETATFANFATRADKVKSEELRVKNDEKYYSFFEVLTVATSMDINSFASFDRLLNSFSSM